MKIMKVSLEEESIIEGIKLRAWIVGVIEKTENKRLFLVEVTRRDRKILMQVIKTMFVQDQSSILIFGMDMLI